MTKQVTITRYAIRFVDTPNYGSLWHCQGSPNDPANFGYAILFVDEQAAINALNKSTSPMCRAHRQYAKIVEVTCTFEES